VVAVGREVATTRPGERVAVVPQAPCRSCALCLRGRAEQCPDRRTLGIRHPWGALADLALVRAEQVVPVPSALTWREIAMLEPLSVAVAAVRRAAPVPGDQVAIVGGGPIGVLAALVTRAGAGCEVRVHEVDEPRAERVRRLGLDLGAGPEARHDVVIDCAGSSSSLEVALRWAAPGGTVVVAAAAVEPAPVNVRLLLVRDLALRASFAYPLEAEAWQRTARLVASGAVPAGAVADRVVEMTDVPAELARLAAGETASLKTLVAVGTDDLDRPGGAHL
jgi:L-iditol 2-dehydrogenase